MSAAALAVCGAACAQEAVDGGAPFKWTAEPDSLQVGLALGERAEGAKRGDSAQIECTLDRNRRPANCTTVSESPGSNMAAAVLEIAKFYKAASTDSTGKTTEGRRVRFAFATAG